MRRSLKCLLLLPCYDYTLGEVYHNDTCVISRSASVDLRPFRTTQVITKDKMLENEEHMMLI